MTITPDQADRMKRDATDGPWDITDQDRRYARLWANDIIVQAEAEDRKLRYHTAARVILATVEAPAPTLAEELRELGALLEEEGGAGAKSTVWARDLANRVEQVEQHNDEVVGIVEDLTEQRDEARADAGDKERQAQYLSRRVSELTSRNATLALQRDEARAEVDGVPVQKGAESTAESLDPADVKPGEAWLVETRLYGRGAAVRIADGEIADRGYNWAFSGHGTQGHFLDSAITLISRLVPAPRVITDPDELDKLATRAVILSTDGQADVYQHDRDGWVDITGTPMDSRSVIRVERAVTVLWEPDA